MVAGVIAQCPSCRALVVVAGIIVDGSVAADGSARAGLCCSACGHTSWLPLSSSSLSLLSSLSSLSSAPSVTDSPVSSVTSVVAPPASSPPASADDLVSTMLAPPAAPLPSTGPSTGPSTSLAASFDAGTIALVRARFTIEPTAAQQGLAARFDRLLDGQWANEAEHKALLKTAAAAGELAFVGHRYRSVLDVVRDESRARAAQQELLTLAMATMSTQRSDEGIDTSPSSAKVALVVLAVVVVGAVVVGLLRMVMGSMSGGVVQ